MPFTDYVRNSLARPVLLEVLAFSLLAFSFSSRGHWNAFSLRLTLAHLHRFITAGPAGGQNEEAQVEELVQRLETLVRNAPEDDERRPHLERALDSLQSLHSRSPQPDGPPSPVSTHGACLSPRMLGLGPLLHSSNTPLSSPLRRPMSPMSPLALSLPALALDRAVPEPHPADVQQSQPHGLLLNLSDPALDDARPTSNAVAEPDAPSTPVQQQARAGLPAAEPHLDDPAFFFRALLLSPRHQRPAAQPRTATTPSRRERDERPVLPLLRERALSAPNLATLPALGLNLHLDVPPSPSMPLPAAPEPYSDDEGEQPAPIALAVDTLPTPSLALPAAPASPCSDDERDVLAPLPSDRRPPLPPVDTAAPPPEAYEDLVSPITFAPAPLSPVREMSPVRFAPPSPSVAALPRADERDWPAFPAVQPQELESPAQVEAEAAPAATVVSDEQPPFEQATPSPIAAAAIPLPEDRVEPESAEVPSPLPGAIQEEEPSEPEHTATPLLLTVHEPLEEDSDSEEGVILDVVPVLPLQVEDTPTAAHAAESQAPAPEPESTQEEEEEEEEEDEQQEELPVVEIPLVIAPSPLLIPALLDEDAITPVSLTPEPTALLVSPKADAVDVPLPPSRPSSALQQIEDDITRSMTFEERNAETTSQPADESEQSGYFNQSHSQSASLSVSTAADGDESPVSTGASSPLTRDNLRQLNLSNGGPRASVSGGSLAWTAQSSAVDALEAALHKLRTMRSSGSLASRSGGSASASASASPSPLRTQFGQPATGASTPSPLRSNFAPALPPPIEDDVSPTFSQFSFTTESPTEDEHMDPEPASSDGLEEALSVPLPKPKRKASKTLLDVPSATPARRRASHLDVPPATSTPLRRASHLDFPRSAILQDDESVSGDDDASEVAPLSLDQILDEVFPSASPEVHPVPSRTIERVPSFDFDFHRAGDGEDSQEDRAHWRDSIRFPGAEGGSRDSLPGPSRGRTKSGRFVRRVLSRLHLGRESAEANASTVSLAPSTPPRSPASSVASSTAQRTHTRRSSKSSGKEPKTQRSRTVSLFSTLSSRRTAMTTPEPVPPVPQAGPSDDTARSRAMSLFASGLGMPAREHGAVEGRRRSMSLFKRGGGKKKRGETAGAEVDVEEPPVPAMPPMPVRTSSSLQTL